MESLKEHHQREDYRELLELTVIFLGGIPPRGIFFRVPEHFIKLDGEGYLLY